MSRRFELEADLFSLQLLDDPESLILALERVGSRDREKSGWRHFSTRRRVDFLVRAAGDPVWAARFRARLRRWAIAGALFALTVGALELRGLVSSYAGDRVWAELSLGRFESAAALAEQGGDELDGELLELARFAGVLAAELDDPAATLQVAELERELQRSLASADLARASSLAELAVLRGAGELYPVAQALEALAEGDRETAGERLEAAEARWEAALAPWLAPQ